MVTATVAPGSAERPHAPHAPAAPMSLAPQYEHSIGSFLSSIVRSRNPAIMFQVQGLTKEHTVDTDVKAQLWRHSRLPRTIAGALAGCVSGRSVPRSEDLPVSQGDP